MGVRQIRYCDITGSEDDVEAHEIHIDQLRVEIDLAAAEYHKLLGILQPYMDAGRLEASAPDTSALPGSSRRGQSSAAPTRPKLSAAERQQLREWAEAQGIPIPSNNRFKVSLVEQWRRETAENP